MKLEKDYDVIREGIIEASKEVFLKYGYIKVSMDDISKASGKGRSTLYHYFKNKREVLEYFCEKELNSVLYAAQSGMQPTVSFIANLSIYTKSKLKSYKYKMLEFNTLIIDIKSDPAFFLQLHKLLVKEEAAIISKIIIWAIGNGEISKLVAEDIQFLSISIVTACRSFEQEMILYGDMENFEKRLDWMINILYKGIK